jgi:hypothetical protein
MRFRATVVKATGKTVHGLGTLRDGLPVIVQKLPTPAWVEIAEEKEGFFLLHFDENREFFSDTWHESLDEAKRQAEFEFSIPSDGWIVVD